jgi:hypothetical protein
MALLQFALVFGNDHFVLPVPVPVGAVFTTSHLLVTDTFGMTLSLAPAAHAQTGGGRAEAAPGAGQCSFRHSRTAPPWRTRSCCRRPPCSG